MLDVSLASPTAPDGAARTLFFMNVSQLHERYPNMTSPWLTFRFGFPTPGLHRLQFSVRSLITADVATALAVDHLTLCDEAVRATPPTLLLPPHLMLRLRGGTLHDITLPREPTHDTFLTSNGVYLTSLQCAPAAAVRLSNRDAHAL